MLLVTFAPLIHFYLSCLYLFGSFLLSISVVVVVASLLFLFIGSVRQIKLATRQLLGARKYIVSYRMAS